MAAADLCLRPATVADDAAIRSLFGETFAHSPKQAVDVMRWQYWENPFAPVRSWVWDDAGTIVAHYAGMPVPVRLDGKAALAAIGIDAATAPSHRGRQLFEKLARMVYEDCGSHGIPVTLCFPNQNSLRGFVKAGGTPLGDVQTWVFALDAPWISSRFKVPLPLSRAALRVGFPRRHLAGGVEVDAPPADAADLWERRRVGTENGVARTEEWWRWRYVDRPGAAYRFFEVRRDGVLQATAVTTAREAFGGRFTFVLEFLADDGRAAREILAVVAGASASTAGLALVALPGSSLAALAKSAGFRRLPRRLEPKPLHFGVVDNASSLDGRASGRWNVSWGDLDHL